MEGQLQEWKDSFVLNMECRDEIIQNAMAQYRGCRLNQFVNQLVLKYGADRPLYVLSRTVQERPHDSIINAAVHAKAQEFVFQDMWDHCADRTEDYIIDGRSEIINLVFYKLLEVVGAVDFKVNQSA